MSGIQMLPGPMDALLTGVMAGAKLRGMNAEVQAMKLRNAAMQKELEYFDANQQLAQGMQQAELERMQAGTALTQVQEEAARQMIPLEKQLREQELQLNASGEQRAQKESGRADRMESQGMLDSLSNIAMSAATPNMSLMERDAFISQLAASRGIKNVKPGTPEHSVLAQQLDAQIYGMQKEALMEATKMQQLQTMREWTMAINAGRLEADQTRNEISAQRLQQDQTIQQQNLGVKQQELQLKEKALGLEQQRFADRLTPDDEFRRAVATQDISTLNSEIRELTKDLQADKYELSQAIATEQAKGVGKYRDADGKPMTPALIRQRIKEAENRIAAIRQEITNRESGVLGPNKRAPQGTSPVTSDDEAILQQLEELFSSDD